MINNDRIVPVERVDYLTLIGTIMTLAGTSYAVAKSEDVEGDFSVTGTGDVGNLLANLPVKTLDFASGVTAGVVYFVPSKDYAGFTAAGSAAYASGSATVNPDGITLYKATLSSGEITVAAVAPIAE